MYRIPSSEPLADAHEFGQDVVSICHQQTENLSKKYKLKMYQCCDLEQPTYNPIRQHIYLESSINPEIPTARNGDTHEKSYNSG